MTAQPDPAWVLQLAWGRFRLDKLQKMVSETITLLNTVEPEQLLGRHLNELEMGFPESPIADALEACRSELREECGMPDAAAHRARHGELVRRHMAESPVWTANFREALEQYRGLAGFLLELACRAGPAEAPAAQ